MPADDTTKGKHVDVEEGWTKNRALGDPTSDSVDADLVFPRATNSVLPVRYD